MALLKALQLLLMMLDGRFKLFYVFCPPFPKCRLGLSVSLFSLFRRRIYLDLVNDHVMRSQSEPMLTGFRPPLRFWT